MKTTNITAILIISLIILTTGCTTPKKTQEIESNTLNLFNWEDYIGEDTLSNFESQFNIKVNLETYEDENFAFSAIKSRPGYSDLIVVSDDILREMESVKLLEKIDSNSLPNFKNIDESFIYQDHTQKNLYSIPYLFGTTGLLINSKYVNATENSWSIAWNPNYKDKITMLIGGQEPLIAALIYSGYSGSSTNPQELSIAKELLLKQKPLLRGYTDNINIIDLMITEKLWVAQEFSGEALQAIKQNRNLRYIIPKEGCTLWTDYFVIPIDAPNKANAQKFLNYILDAQVSAKIANDLWYGNANKAAKQFTNPQLLNDPTAYPSPQSTKNCEYSKDLGEAQSQWNKILSELENDIN